MNRKDVPDCRRLPHNCPTSSCTSSADTIESLEDVFGSRVDRGKLINQSWCRECRAEERRLAALKRGKNA